MKILYEYVNYLHEHYRNLEKPRTLKHQARIQVIEDMFRFILPLNVTKLEILADSLSRYEDEIQ